MRGAALSLVGLALLSACGPIPVAQAERECFDRARLAERPRGTVALGVGSGGHSRVGVGIAISSDFIMGNDPSAIYDQCVLQKSGQPPSRPLYTRPDWRG